MGERAIPERVFLDWSGPALPAAARWLLDHVPQPTAGDLSGVLGVVPGGRAKRRLIELLAQLAAERRWVLVPPTVTTVGGLADRLMPTRAQAELAVADRATSQLVRAGVLREAGSAMLSSFTPSPPGRDDWPGWWSLSAVLGKLSDELGTVGLTPQSAAERFEVLSGDARWSALGGLDALYHAALAAAGFVDVHAARAEAVAPDADVGAARVPRVVLLATPDLKPIHTRLLERYASQVSALVFAPSEHQAGFDAWGVLSPGYWLERRLPVADAAIAMVDRPEDQAAEVLDALARWGADEPVEVDRVTVGLGDAALSGVVQRSLELAGVPARSVEGTPVTRSRPMLLLEALGEYASARRFDRLASLLRHPDALRYASDQAREAGVTLTREDGGWLGLLDRYASDHLHGELTGQWLGDDDTRAQLGAIERAVRALLPEGDASARRPLDAWAAPIGGAMHAVYASAALRRHAPDDRPVVLGLEAVGGVLETLRPTPGESGAAYMPETTYAQAVRFVLGQIDPTPVPEPGGAAAVELVGVLEVALDDADRVVVVGVNEGSVPQPIADHPMLPREVRGVLGLDDDDHRLARDQLSLSAVVASRAAGDCLLVAGRVSPAGDPLMPSRLLLRTEDAVMSRRVVRFFSESGSPDGRPGLLTPGGVDRFVVPPPMLDEPVLTGLSVTAFRDYLACPYRFYLKHVRKLRLRDDSAVELDGAAFGSLAHVALRVLGDPALAEEDRPDKLHAHLGAALDACVKRRYGLSPLPAVRLQVEQLRYRLGAVAHEQARLVREGWRVRAVEAERGRIEQTIEVDDEPFTLRGAIDRIDVHGDGRVRVIDYKTSDKAKTPEQTHRKGPKDDKQWTDLQLPLYRDLCAAVGVAGDQAELAYFNVPKQRSGVALALAGWSADELAAARAVRDDVIRALRARRYWPPSDDLPAFDDGLAGVCADLADDRTQVIRRSGPAIEPPERGGGDG